MLHALRNHVAHLSYPKCPPHGSSDVTLAYYTRRVDNLVSVHGLSHFPNLPDPTPQFYKGCSGLLGTDALATGTCLLLLGQAEVGYAFWRGSQSSAPARKSSHLSIRKALDYAISQSAPVGVSVILSWLPFTRVP